MFKPALCIELHDQKMALYRRDQDYPSTFLSGRHEDEKRTVGSINVGDLIILFDALGLGNTKYGDSVLKKMSNAYPQPRMRADSTHLPVYTDYQSECTRIVDLQCEIIAPNMINILVTELFEEEKEEYQKSHQNITYCGSFTVWWAEDTK